MNITELRNYKKWIGQSADQVYFSARAVGGWKTVFPNSLPKWASKVRNYFNVLPSTLRRVPDKNAKDLMKHVEKFKFMLECHEVQSANRTYRNYKPNPNGKFDPPPFKEPQGCPVNAEHDVKHTGLTDSLAVKNALSGQVFLDQTNRPWFQMAAGSTIYHFGRHPGWFPSIEAVWQDKVRGQNDTPVFKFVSPDNTGGSNEVILFNDGVSAHTFGGGSETVGAAGQTWDIRKIVVTDPLYQGSYNYSETAEVGLAQHELRDVKPHVHSPIFYVNPMDAYSSLQMRKFPAIDNERRDLASQV